MLMKMEMQRCIQRLHRYTIRDLPKKLGFFAVFTFKIELWIVLNSNNENIMRRKKNGSTWISGYCFGPVALPRIWRNSLRRHFFFSVLDTGLNQILQRQFFALQNLSKLEPKKKINGQDVLTAPWYVSVSTKYGIVHFDDCHCGSPPIAVAVECRCRPAVSLSMPTPNKVSTGCSGKNWL